MKEKDITTRIIHWLRDVHRMTGAFEIKITHTKSLPYSRLLPHQRASLLSANSGERGIVWKLPDCGYYNPFDVVSLISVPAYVVVMFYERGCKEFFMIPIKLWCISEANSKRKSLTHEKALAIGVRCEL